MKRILLTLVTLVLVVTSVFAFAACNRELPDVADISGYGESAPDAAVVGDKIVPISSAMKKDSRLMFLNAVDNFYKADFAAALLLGKVDTDVKISKVTQMVECLRLHDGDDVFMYNNSYTAQGPSFVDIKVMEKYFIDGSKGELTDEKDTREYKIISAKESGNVTLSKQDPEDENSKTILTAKAWPVDETYANHDDYMKVYPNDPSVLNMYLMDKTTVKKATPRKAKFVDAATANKPMGYYTFDLECNAIKAFNDNGYIDVMEYMLNQSVPGNVNQKAPMVLKFSVEIWENGLFKRYIVTEGYSVKAMGIIDGEIELISEVKFSYDKEENPMSKFYNKETGKFVYDAVAV